MTREAGSTEPEPYLGERIREVLAQDPRVAELGLSVAVVGERVMVTGTVATPERRRAVEEVVTPLLGGLELHNGVTVSTLSEGEGEEVIG